VNYFDVTFQFVPEWNIYGIHVDCMVMLKPVVAHIDSIAHPTTPDLRRSFLLVNSY
jgi:hypothetical protein